MGDFWVFGYGSLMWNPGFAYRTAGRARLHGYRRALCVRSFVHRGTPERPGLVLGLDRGGACVGMAFEVEAARREETLAYLRARELVTSVYLERWLPVRMEDGRSVEAVCYVTDRTHIQYAGRLDVEHAAGIVIGAQGRSGPNEAYVLSAAAHLAELGLRDPWLEAVAARLQPVPSHSPSHSPSTSPSPSTRLTA